jgi:GAF domain-containing protein/anti-sigma regulatory factor (Ser/Thr protein kinase)
MIFDGASGRFSMQGHDVTIVPANLAEAPPRTSAARRRRGPWIRLPRLAWLAVWAVPLAVFLILIALTFALWLAEYSLESQAALSHRGSWWVLGGGLTMSVLTASFVYLALLHRGRAHERTRRHLRALESLQANASNIIARVDTGAGALTELCESARQLLGMDRSGIQLLDAAAGRLELLAHGGDMPASPPRFYPLDSMPNMRWCLDTGKVLFAEDVLRLDTPQNHSLLKLFRVRALVVIPLTVLGERIGMMTLSSSEPRRGFDDVERRLAEVLGSQAAVVLANNRLYQAQQSAAQKYKALVDQRELLYSTNASIFQTAGLDESLGRIAELAPLALGVDACVVALSARPPDNVRVAAITPGVKARGGMRVGTTFFCTAAERAFQRGVACVFSRAQEDPDVAQIREIFPDMGSMACVPMSGRDGARMGVLMLVRRQTGVFSPEQLKMARLFSTRAAAAIENARLYQETRRALEVQKKLLAQRDTLWSVNAALYQAGTLQETLERIIRLAPGALGVDLCAVSMTGQREGEIVLGAITGNVSPDLVGGSFDVRELNAGTVLRTRELMVIPDARSDPGIPPSFRERFNVQAVAYFPLLRNDGEPLGLLTLVRHRPGPFDPAQIEMARVFSTRAASAIENAQLLEQTRRDAATKAMLLRELNHRVKNNLAGIVALLSMGEPEMPPAARRWLDRVTDRVRVMAGAHQLFVSDAERVPLANLVERMLSSLAVTRTPGVDVKLDLATAPGVELRTEQAISLAMALHELCYNAIVHGLGGAGGCVTLRTRDAGNGRLAVDVIDNGRGFADAERRMIASGNENGDSDGSGEPTGIGLEIVKGLVSRELHGSFSLAAAAGGGTVATVEFPLSVGAVHAERDAS